MIIHGDCMTEMAQMDADSIDAIVTDPPYGLEFMGKAWDGEAIRGAAWEREARGPAAHRLASGRTTTGFTQSDYAGAYDYSKNEDYQAWTLSWATQALRVIKPGGSMLCFGGTRTFHRLTCGLEDAGFIIKDCLMWLYGQGFPKAQDLGKVLDKRAGVERKVVGVKTYAGPAGNNDNFGVAGSATENEGKRDLTAPATPLAHHWDGYKIGGIKPAWEIIVWCAKPPEGSWTDNVLKYGVGAVNVDECRVEGNPGDGHWGQASHKSGRIPIPLNISDGNNEPYDGNPKGRFPANLLLSHTPECRQVGTRRVKGSTSVNANRGERLPSTVDYANHTKKNVTYADSDGLETCEDWSCHEDCAVRLLDEQSGGIHGAGSAREAIRECEPTGMFALSGDGQRYGDTGGASRFFYTSKATDRQPYNDHPTLKPTDLIEWLVRLVTRPGQLVLDPFAGSGTTGVACIHAGREYVLIDQDEHYCEIAERRTTEGVQRGMF